MGDELRYRGDRRPGLEAEDFQRHMLLVPNHKWCNPSSPCRTAVPKKTGNVRPEPADDLDKRSKIDLGY